MAPRFVAGVDQLKEQVAAAGHDREIANLVHDEQGEAAIEADLLAQGALPFRLRQCPDEIGQGEEVHAAAGFDGLDAKGDGEVAFAGAGWPDEVHHLGAVDELQLGQSKDPVAVERGLERESRSR